MGNRNILGTAAAVAILCAAGAYAWYSAQTQRATSTGSVRLAATAPAGTTAPATVRSTAPSGTPTPAPVVYVIAQSTPASTAAPNAHGSGTATIVPAPAAPLAGTPTSIPDLPAHAIRATAYSAPPPPIIIASNAAPRIISLSISTPVVHSGETVSGKVETSTNVASVEARIGGYSSNLRKTGAGRFSLDYRVPYVPFFMKRTYTVRIIARNTRGDAVSTEFPITVR